MSCYLKNVKERSINFFICGQGVFIFANKTNDSLVFTVKNKEQTDGLKIEIQIDAVSVTRIISKETLVDKNNNRGLTEDCGAYYWFSLDSQNQRLYVGIGEARIETTIYNYSFPSLGEDHDLWEANKTFLESLKTICFEGNNISPLRLLKDPITTTVSLVVADTNMLTLDDIASGKYMPSANLTTIGKKLYDCVSGKRFVLDTLDFPDFSKAIEYNIATPKCWCYQRLIEKSTEFNKDEPNINETYLRITLGENDGESPGIPYVLEIWPVGHYSPIHSHANANAIIRVLHGSINVALYPFLCKGNSVEPFSVANFKKNDVTWITPTLNQTHRLKNLEDNNDTCITIQCYMYGEKDISHYDYFDYIENNGDIETYEPDSDMDFLSFKKIIREQWENRPNKNMNEVTTGNILPSMTRSNTYSVFRNVMREQWQTNPNKKYALF